MMLPQQTCAHVTGCRMPERTDNRTYRLARLTGLVLLLPGLVGSLAAIVCELLPSLERDPAALLAANLVGPWLEQVPATVRKTTSKGSPQ